MRKESKSESIFMIITNESDCKKANKLATIILQSKCAACVSFGDVKSAYWWEGTIEESKEVQMLIKTNSINLTKTIDLIAENHSYENPEILHWELCASSLYKEWVDNVLIN